jgi:hypothetical protein
MPCVWLKNGVRLNLTEDAFKDEVFMARLKKIGFADPPKRPPMTPEQKREYWELCERLNPSILKPKKKSKRRRFSYLFNRD